jgi:hypothetical protein
MWRAFKILIFLWPAAVMVYFISDNIFDGVQVERKLSDADGLIWGNGDEQITVNVEQTSFGEQATYAIAMVGNDGETLAEDEFLIDEDMFGGGFIKAYQADDDEELELVVWGAHEEDESYLLDYSEGEITRKNFYETSAELHGLTEQWHQAQVMGPFGLFLLGILFFGYYVVVAIVGSIIGAIVRARARAAESSIVS